MSQIPVKIAENYKPPKKVTLNQNIAQRLTNASNVTAHCTYEFSLEHSILVQMNEWQNIRQRTDDERKKRLCSYQQQRQKQYEENQKQIITAVSYPSTDDLSSDDDGDSGHGTSSDSKPASATKIPIANASAQQFQFSPTNRFDSILVPTVMGGRHGNQSDNGNVTKSKTPLHSKFNFQEFENYSSNPFDNVEMKTINDLDILTEVWNSSVAISKTADSTESQPSEPETPTQPDVTQQPNDSQNNFTQNECYNTNQLYHTQTQHSELKQTQLNHSTAAITNIVPTQLNDYYSNQMNFNYQSGNGGGAMGTAFLPNQPIHTIPINNNTSYGNTQNQYVNTYYNSMISGAPGRTMETTDSVNNKESVIATQSKSKSRSVPDIVKVVNGGDSQSIQGRRTRNSSQCRHRDFSNLKEFQHFFSCFFYSHR